MFSLTGGPNYDYFPRPPAVPTGTSRIITGLVLTDRTSIIAGTKTDPYGSAAAKSSSCKQVYEKGTETGANITVPWKAKAIQNSHI